MYACLRAASTTPSVCLLCTHLSRFRRPPSTIKRRYAAQVALARPPTPGGVEAGPSDLTSSSATRAREPSSSEKSHPERSAKAKPQNAKSKATKARLKALKEAEEAERRRRALATLDKTTKFVEKVKQTSHEPTFADLEQLTPKNRPLITLKYIYPEPSSRLHRGSPSDAVIERYNTAVKALVGALTKRFRRIQLLRLLKEGMRQRKEALLGTPRSFSSLKRSHAVAEEILRWLWHWPYVTEVKERKAYLTTRVERVYQLTTSEFFLLLGSDGSSLLALTADYEIVVKKVERTQDGFSIVVEGANAMLDALAVVLAERKRAMITETISIGSPDRITEEPPSNATGGSIRPDLMKRISRISNALVEDKGNGTVSSLKHIFIALDLDPTFLFQISAHHHQHIAMAVRLVTRAYQQATLPPPSLLAHLPTLKDSAPGMLFPHTYALFPFELPAGEILPWTWASTGILSMQSPSTHQQAQSSSSRTTPVSSSGAPYLFRARKVSEWLEQDIVGQRRVLREGVGRLMSSSGKLHALRNVLGLPDFDGTSVSQDQHARARRRTITASTGHIVLATGHGHRSTPTPPLRGSWIFPKLFDWMKTDTGRVTFIPSPPQAAVTSSSSGQTTLNRIVYRAASFASNDATDMQCAAPLQTLKLDVGLPLRVQPRTALGPDVGQIESEEDFMSNQDATIRSIYAEEGALADLPPISSTNSTDIQSEEQSTSKDTSEPIPDNPHQLWTGVETFVNVMLPDCPADLQLSSFNSIRIPREAEPSELQMYAANLIQYLSIGDAVSRPEPPLHVTYDGTHYVLDTSTTVRRSSRLVADDSVVDTESPMEIVTEVVIDLDSDQKVSTSHVTCSEANTLPAWQEFLGKCDRLTWLSAKSTPSTSFSELEDSTPENSQ